MPSFTYRTFFDDDKSLVATTCHELAILIGSAAVLDLAVFARGYDRLSDLRVAQLGITGFVVSPASFAHPQRTACANWQLAKTTPGILRGYDPATKPPVMSAIAALSGASGPLHKGLLSRRWIPL
jgi:hypothetical protein